MGTQDWTLEKAKRQLLVLCHYMNEGLYSLEHNPAFQWLCERAGAQTTVEIRVADLPEVQYLLDQAALAVEQMCLIEALTSELGVTLTIHGSGPKQHIAYYREFELGSAQYEGETLLDCLQQAAKEHLPSDDESEGNHGS